MILVDEIETFRVVVPKRGGCRGQRRRRIDKGALREPRRWGIGGIDEGPNTEHGDSRFVVETRYGYVCQACYVLGHRISLDNIKASFWGLEIRDEMK